MSPRAVPSSRLSRCDEDAKGMAVEVGVHVEALLRVVGTVEEELRPEPQCPLVLLRQRPLVRHRQVEVRLLRRLRAGPRRARAAGPPAGTRGAVPRTDRTGRASPGPSGRPPRRPAPRRPAGSRNRAAPGRTRREHGRRSRRARPAGTWERRVGHGRTFMQGRIPPFNPAGGGEERGRIGCWTAHGDGALS